MDRTIITWWIVTFAFTRRVASSLLHYSPGIDGKGYLKFTRNDLPIRFTLLTVPIGFMAVFLIGEPNQKFGEHMHKFMHPEALAGVPGLENWGEMRTAVAIAVAHGTSIFNTFFLDSPDTRFINTLKLMLVDMYCNTEWGLSLVLMLREMQHFDLSMISGVPSYFLCPFAPAFAGAHLIRVSNDMHLMRYYAFIVKRLCWVFDDDSTITFGRGPRFLTDTPIIKLLLCLFSTDPCGLSMLLNIPTVVDFLLTPVPTHTVRSATVPRILLEGDVTVGFHSLKVYKLAGFAPNDIYTEEEYFHQIIAILFGWLAMARKAVRAVGAPSHISQRLNSALEDLSLMYLRHIPFDEFKRVAHFVYHNHFEYPMCPGTFSLAITKASAYIEQFVMHDGDNGMNGINGGSDGDSEDFM